MRIKTDKFENASFVRRKCAWAAAAVVPLLLAGCGEEKVVEVLVRPVKAMVVPEPVTERVLTYSGVIAPRIESTLGFRVSGKITERYVNVGDRLRPGRRSRSLTRRI